jgi:hypothetical protein
MKKEYVILEDSTGFIFGELLFASKSSVTLKNARTMHIPFGDLVALSLNGMNNDYDKNYCFVDETVAMLKTTTMQRMITCTKRASDSFRQYKDVAYNELRKFNKKILS